MNLDFNPNDVGLLDNGIFGLPFNSHDDCELIIIPVPWQTTVSYREGTALAFEKIKIDSLQVDLYDHDAVNMWKKGYYMTEPQKDIINLGKASRTWARTIIEHLENGGNIDDPKTLELLQNVNDTCQKLNHYVQTETEKYLSLGKKVCLLGGDHSTPLGFIHALQKKHESFSILQIDAHADLRKAYEGFLYSHASIMYNVLQECHHVEKLVQVGIRDFCDEELEISKTHPKVETFFFSDIRRKQYAGENLKTIWDNVFSKLTKKVYISFDIDGLDPALCPNTGTPVPDGFQWEEISYLLKRLVDEGFEIIGFDLNEVCPKEGSIDGIVGARVLYKLCNLMMKSNDRTN